MVPVAKRFNYFEVVFVIRRHDGMRLAEYTMSEKGHVQIVNYWPSGMIESHGKMTLDQFLEEVNRIRGEASPS